MNDEDVGIAMRRLPRTKASPRFTAEVIRALHREAPSLRSWRLVAAAAVALMLVVGSYAASVRHERQQHLQALRAERQRIASEFRRGQKGRGDAAPGGGVADGATPVLRRVGEQHKTKQHA